MSPTLSPLIASYWMWVIWYVTWWFAAFTASRAVARPRWGGGVLHRLFAVIGVVLLFWVPTSATGPAARLADAAGLGPDDLERLIRPLWITSPEAGWALCGALLLCFVFCWWARLHLGRLWSGLVTTKADHRVVDTGPYRIVRHPIYTGVIVGALFTACIKASLPAFAGFGFLWLGFWMTARIEEGFLRQELGADAYDAYSRRTPMLFPLIG